MPPRSARLLTVLLTAVLATAWWGLRSGPGETPPPATGSATPSAAETPHDAAPANAETNRRERAVPDPVAAGTPPQPTATAEHTATAAPVVIIRGRVVDARGNGLAEATVARLDDAAAFLASLPASMRVAEQTKTAADGTFELGLPQLGPFALRASHAEHPATEQRGTAPQAAGETLVITLRDGVTITGRVVGAPADAGTITVSAQAIEGVVEKATKNPLGAMLDLGSLLEGMELPNGAATATAAADGAFELRGLDPDRRYRLAAAHQPTSALVPQRCTASVEVGAGARGVELPWREPFVVVARVLDAETGRPMETLEVAFGPVQEMKMFGQSIPVPMLMPRPEHAFAKGEVVVRGMVVDPDKTPRFGLQIAAVGRRTWSRDDLRPPPQGRLDLGTITLATAPIVHVTVTHRGLPVAGASVRLEMVEGPADPENPRFRHTVSFGASIGDEKPATAKTLADSQRTLQRDRATTAADGTCELTAEQVGSARLAVTASAFAPATGEEFRLPERGAVQQKVELTRGATAVVRVVDGRDQALAGAKVRCDDADVEQGHATDAAGTVRFEHLAIGEHTFALTRPERGGKQGVKIAVDGHRRTNDTTRAVATFADEETRQVLLREPLRGTVRGTVTLDGEPLEHAEVRLTAAAADTHDAAIEAAVAGVLGGLLGTTAPDDDSTRTDDDGAFTLRDVPAGEYRLVVNHRRLAMPANVDCRVAEGDNRADVSLRRTLVRGRVLDGDGRPLAGATVTVDRWSTQDDELTEATSSLRDFFGGNSHGGVRTDDDGAFELTFVQPGVPLRLQASSPMHVAGDLRVDAVTAGSTRDGLELRLAAAGRIRVRCGVEGAVAVAATWAGPTPAPPGPHERTQMLKNGRATLDGLPPGTWRLNLDGTDAAKQHTVDVTVTAGQTASAEL